MDDIKALDDRVRFYLEESLGLSLDDLPEDSIPVVQFPERGARTLKLGSVRKNRLLIRRIGSRAIALAVPEIMNVIKPLINSLHTWELFSPLGVAELDRALGSIGYEALGGALHYTLSDTDFAGAGSAMRIDLDKLLTSDHPPVEGEFDGEYVDAFGVAEEGKYVSVAQIRWKTPRFIEVAVHTDEPYRQRGYGSAVVTAATEWLLSQGAAGHYPVTPDNLPSCRIARRLGFKVGWFEIFGRQLRAK